MSCAETVKVLPGKAWIIHTKSREFGISEQKMLSDVTEKVIKDDDDYAVVESQERPTNIFDDISLFIAFPEKKFNDLDGYFIIKITPQEVKKLFMGNKRGYLKVDTIWIEKSEESFSLNIKGESNTTVIPWIYYSLTPDIIFRWTYRDIRENVDFNQWYFFDAYRFQNEFIKKFTLSGSQNIEINPLFIDQGLHIHYALQILNTLNEEFAQDGTRFLWLQEKIDKNKFDEVIDKMTNKYSSMNEKIIFSAYFECKKLGIRFNERVVFDIAEKIIIKGKDNKLYPALLGIKIWRERKEGGTIIRY